MVRKYERKTDRANISPDIMLKAVREVKIYNLSIRQVASKYNINYRTLARYCKKIPEKDYVCEDITVPTVSVGYTKIRQVFNDSQEEELVNYIQRASDIYFNLSPKEMKILAYNLASYNLIAVPTSWIKNKMAGEGWFNALLERHSDLPVRKPKAGSTCFNRANVELFYKHLRKIISHHHFQPQDIWNMDEIGITTVKIPNRIVPRKDYKDVGSTVKTGCENIVTMACTISAIGNHMPLFFTSPRIHFMDDFIQALPESSGTANKSSWMQEKDFEQFLKYFHTHAKCSIERPALLLLDKYSSRLTIQSLKYAEEHGIVMLSFPLNCSHKLQPLDRTVFAHFKNHVNSASNTWVLNNPDHTMSIPEIIAVAYPLAVTPTNIQEGFRCTGIYPYDENIFSDSDFTSTTSSTNSYRLPVEENENNYEQAMIIHTADVEATNSSECHISQSFPEKSDEVLEILSCEVVHSDAKVSLQRSPCNYNNACNQVTANLTDTSEKRELELENIENENTNKSIERSFRETNIKTKGNNFAEKCNEVEEGRKYRMVKEMKEEGIDVEEKVCCCSVCLKSYPISLSKKKWFHCVHCKEWAHEACISEIVHYTCHNCKST